MQNRPLTRRQHLFAEAIKAGSDEIEAAIKAGFPPQKARQSSIRLGDHPKVIAAIAGLLPEDQFYRPPKKAVGPNPQDRAVTAVQVDAGPAPMPTSVDLSRDWVIDRLMAIAEGRVGFVVVMKERLQALNQLRAFLGPQTVQDKPTRKKIEEVEKTIAAPPLPQEGSLASLFRGNIQAKH